MRLPNSAHEARPWRIREIAHDFTLEDCWALPAYGVADDFPRLLELMAASDPLSVDSLPTRFLWRLRDVLGRIFDLGEITVPADGAADAADRLPIPGTDIASLAERLPDELSGTAADVRFEALPFVPLYRTGDEFAAEVSNKTMHGVLHLAWVEQGNSRYQAQMAVYVKPRGRFGKAYMAAIKPFRYWIVYPALMRHVGRTWDARAATVA